MKPKVTVAISLVLLVLGVGAYAFAAAQGDSVATYTGCLKNGKLESLAVGESPLSPCAAATQVRLSGGDVTGVTAGTGLTGGGGGGDVALAVDPSAVQARVAAGCLGTRQSRSTRRSARSTPTEASLATPTMRPDGRRRPPAFTPLSSVAAPSTARASGIS